MSTEILAFLFLWGSGVFLTLCTSGRIRNASSISFRSPASTGESRNGENCCLLHFPTSVCVPWHGYLLLWHAGGFTWTEKRMRYFSKTSWVEEWKRTKESQESFVEGFVGSHPYWSGVVDDHSGQIHHCSPFFKVKVWHYHNSRMYS